MEKIDEFMLEEYRQAQNLTFDVDDKRVSLTKYFFAVIGILLAALLAIGKGETKNIPMRMDIIMPLITFVIWILTFIIIIILARLRKVQIEHFRIILNIRAYFVGKDYNLWNILQLSEKTIPKEPTSTTGTYFWTLLVIVVGSFLLPLTLVFTDIAGKTLSDIGFILLYFFSVMLFHIIYMRTAQPNAELVYKEGYEPYTFSE